MHCAAFTVEARRGTSASSGPFRYFIFLSWSSARPGRRHRLFLHFMPHFLLLPLVCLPRFLLAYLHPLSLVLLRYLSTSPRRHSFVHRLVPRGPASPALEIMIGSLVCSLSPLFSLAHRLRPMRPRTSSRGTHSQGDVHTIYISNCMHKESFRLHRHPNSSISKRGYRAMDRYRI